MRVAVVHSRYASAESGENSAVDNQVAALQRSGHQVELIESRTPSEPIGLNRQVKYGLNVMTGIGPSPLALLNRFSPDLVHVHNLFPNWGLTWLHRAPWPVVVTLHNYRLICAAGTLSREGRDCELCPTVSSGFSVKYACYRKSRLRTIPLAVSTSMPNFFPTVLNADALVVPSHQMKQRFGRLVPGFEAKGANVIPNFSPDSLAPAESRRLGRREGYVFVGRLSEEKGVLELVRAWPDGYKLRILGDGPLREALELAADQKNIHFEGHCSPKRVQELLLASRGLVFPSVAQESASSLAYIEALQCGLPVVAKAGTVVANDVENFRTGVVFQDFSKLREALASFEDSCTGASSRALERFRTEFSESRWVERTCSMYDAVVRLWRSNGTKN